jgi:hypothetical protein
MTMIVQQEDVHQAIIMECAFVMENKQLLIVGSDSVRELTLPHYHKRRKGKSKLILLLIILHFALSGVNDAKVNEKDALTVKNKAIPLMGDLKLDLQEETVIDSSRANNECDVHFIRDMLPDSEGNMAVLTYEHIYKLNTAGKLLKSLKIKLGQGPGEFQGHPSRMYRGSLDNLYISDGYKLIVFDKSLEFKKNIYRVIHPGSGLCVGQKGFLYTLETDYSSSEIYRIMVILDERGKLLKKIFSYHDPEIVKGKGVTIFSSHQFKPHVYYCLDSDNHLIYGYSLEYKLYKCSHSGNLLSTFAVDKKPQTISTKEKSEIKNLSKRTKISGPVKEPEIEFPPHRPFFKGIFSDEKGRIYVFRMKSVLDKSKEEIVDIFSKDGDYLYQTKLPCFPKSIRNGVVYFMEEDDSCKDKDPIYKIKKLTINNYGSIKY